MVKIKYQACKKAITCLYKIFGAHFPGKLQRTGNE
jgi:hypothetical protein